MAKEQWEDWARRKRIPDKMYKEKHQENLDYIAALDAAKEAGYELTSFPIAEKMYDYTGSKGEQIEFMKKLSAENKNYTKEEIKQKFKERKKIND
jgi:hypothetical protein